MESITGCPSRTFGETLSHHQVSRLESLRYAQKQNLKKEAEDKFPASLYRQRL
jgi:hypothetical protein